MTPTEHKGRPEVNRFLDDVSEADYHADEIGSPRPSLSASVAHTLIAKSPLHAWMRHPKLGNAPREQSTEMDRGTRIHALVLGTPLQLSVITADNYRTKAAQEQRDAAYANGLMPILARELDAEREIARCITEQLKSCGIAFAGSRETVAVWEEPSGRGPVSCRGKLDHVCPPAIDDLKTCRSAHPDKLARHVTEYGYHIQAAAYCSALASIHPEAAGRIRFRWIFAEILDEPAAKGPRAIVTVARPSGAMMELGAALWRRAVETWAACLEEDRWPGYAESEAALDPPSWAMDKLLEVES